MKKCFVRSDNVERSLKKIPKHIEEELIIIDVIKVSKHDYA
jgi:ribosomal protein S21